MPEMMMSSQEDPKIKILEDKLSELEDYQLLNKLDVIAIKDQIEHIEKLSEALTPETQQRLAWVEQITKSDKFQSIEKLIDEVHNIETALEQAKTGLSADQIENLKNEVANKVSQDVASLKQKLETTPAGKVAVPVATQFDSSGLENEINELKSKIARMENSELSGSANNNKKFSELQNKMDNNQQGLTSADRENMLQEFDARLRASENKIYAELRSSLQSSNNSANDGLKIDKAAIEDVRKLTEGVKTEIEDELNAKFADLETRIKPMESYPDFRNELKAEVDKISDFTMRDLNQKMNLLQEAISKSGMDETKREIYEDFHKFKISIIDQISKSADDVEAKVMPQINTWRADAEKALQNNKDAYTELVKFKISTMDEMNKKTKEIKESVMIQVPAEIHSMRADVDNKMQKFEEQISEIKMLKTDIEDFRKKLERSKVGELDKLAGDVERVKARSEWLEDELLKKDITSINERLDELETEIQKTRAMMPIVLE
ncbi:MAG: hypothetical protein HYT71_03320 [Candidatus Aenigmarchaeota archaeon]|nr:hypothetical protein [Candidatus Aenigmarchaeota archaeon]